jgi:amino acid adenylation domain-containing protein
MSQDDPRMLNGVSAGAGQTMHYNRDHSLHEIVHVHALAQPNATAVVFGDKAVTYGELDRLSSALANRLASRGIGKGDVVGLFLPRCLDAIIAQLAILKAGAAYAPIDPAYPADHLAYVIAESEPKAIFTSAAYEAKIRAIAGMPAAMLDLGAEIADLANAPASPPPAVRIGGGDPAYVMYTSGSTGRPKGVVVPHRAIARVVLDQNYIEFRPEDVVLHAATISFDASTLEIWGALLNGCKLAGMPDTNFSLSRLCDVMRGNGVTIAWLTTGLFNLFADHAGGNLPRLRHVIFGGEVGSAEHARRFQKVYPGCRLTNGYGPTETTVFATAFEVPPDFAGTDLPIGKAIAHTGVHVVADDLAELPAGVEGQLAISGDGLAIGYLKRPDLTAEKFVTARTAGGPLRCYLTGDFAILGIDGTVTFKGRRDRQVKIDGKRIELDEIESALRRDPRLADAIVDCEKEGQTARRITAYLRPRERGAGANSDFLRNVMADLRSSLPAYMIPAAAMVIDEYPLNPAGKVDRSKLPAIPREPQTAPLTMPIASGTEQLLIRLWKDVLGSAGSTLDRNFFDLGGTSLQLMRVHANLEAALGRSIDVVALFSHPTIRGLAMFLDGKSSSSSSRAALASQRAAMQKRTMAQLRRGA